MHLINFCDMALDVCSITLVYSIHYSVHMKSLTIVGTSNSTFFKFKSLDLGFSFFVVFLVRRVSGTNGTQTIYKCQKSLFSARFSLIMDNAAEADAGRDG